MVCPVPDRGERRAHDLAARARFRARVSRYLSDGPPPAAERVNRVQVRERYGI